MDATLVEQVIINLIENALLHAGKTLPVELNVTVEGNWAVFEVCDRGKGLKEEEIPRIFDGYRSNWNGSSDSTRGIGIGLSICMAIVKSHGGKMTAANRPGGGAVFTFCLPIEEDGNEQ